MSEKQKKQKIVTIDGPAGVGKTSLSRMLAAQLGYTCMDTGAMYRAFAWVLANMGKEAADLEEDEYLLGMLRNLDMELLPPLPGEENGRVRLGASVLGPELRTEEISRLASAIGALPPVREVLTAMQQRLGAAGEVVIEGRDTGTVVFPDAAWKFFLDAEPAERARRRAAQLRARGEADIDEAALLRDIIARDEADRTRAIAPLKPAADAYILDTTKLDIKQVLGEMLVHIQINPA